MSTENWYTLSIEAVMETLKTSNQGLEEEEAKKRLEKYGLNEIAEAEKISLWRMFLNQFKDIMVIILLFAVAISLFVAYRRAENPIEAIVISIIIVFNAVFGLVQEYRSEKALEALKQLAADKATVMRGGELEEVFARELVPGDLVYLDAGDQIPADIRVSKSINLQVDEAVLTGESTPVWKETSPLRESPTPVVDRKNMAFLGTLATSGRGQGIVVETGMQTEFGKIAGMIQEAEKKETPLQKNLQTFGKQLAGIVLGLALLVFLAQLYRATDYTLELVIDMFIVAIALAVAAIPEGLPAVVTISLALGVQRMVKRHSIMRRLPAVETLGSTTVICSDKTGTITKNELTVRKIYVNGVELDITGRGYEPRGEFLREGKAIDPKSDKALVLLLEIGALCNNADLQENGDLVGDPTEGALVIVAEKGGIHQDKLKEKYPLITEFSFDSARKRMTTIHQTPEGKKVAYVKGAPEILLDRSSAIYEAHTERKMASNDKETLLEYNQQFASEALRVLAVAYKVLPEELTEYASETIETDLVFVGLAGMIDPPRDEVQNAIQTAYDAGIEIKMITGDQALTAKAVAQEVGLTSEEGEVITGSQLDSMDDNDLEKSLDTTTVYARVAPEHKVRLVNSLQKKGHIVAMTGDGVNDAPAVKHADIGISMGIRGTDVTKEASDMVLADDNFATIVAAVDEGRAIYANIKKFIRYLLAANTSEVLVIFIAAMMGLQIFEHGTWVTVLPLTAIQILWINVVTDGLPAIALGVDPADPDVMKHPPRDPSEKILEQDGILYILVIGVLATLATLAVFLWQLEFDLSTFSINPDTPEITVKKAKTAAFTTLVLFELLFVFNARSESRFVFGRQLINNKYLIIAVLVSFTLHLAVVYIPPLQSPFETTSLGLREWVVIVGVCIPSLLIPPKLFIKPKYHKKTSRPTPPATK